MAIELIGMKTPVLALIMILSQATLVAGAEIIILKKEQSGQEIKVKAGALIQIELAGIGGTGYSWHLDRLDPRYLKLISQETRKVSEGLVGGPVLHVWRIKAEQAGQTEIKMAYYRQWEGPAKAAEHFSIKVNISKNERIKP